jgi:WS/DGAT/MGAT family acyltransferase
MMWDMEMPTSLMTVMGLMLLDERVKRRDLEQVIANRLLQFPKFRQKIVMKNRKPFWHIDEDFNIRSHVRHVALPEPAGYDDLQSFVSDLMGTPLDYSKPLWQVHLVDHYNGGSAVIWRIHHAIADGIALVKVIFSLTGETADDSLEEIKWPEQSANGELKPGKSMVRRLRGTFNSFTTLGRDLYKEAAQWVKEPQIVRDTLMNGWTTTRELSRLFTDKPRENSMFVQPLGVAKRVAWSEPVALSHIKTAGKRLGATVNDILLALMTGAFRKHLIEHHEDLDAQFRVICPVNVRRGSNVEINNKVGMISFNLPVHIQEREEVIQVISKRTRELKRSLEPLAVYAILNIVGDYVPKKLGQRAAAIAGKRLTGVLSNVPGPRHSIYFCGTKMNDIMFWLPQTHAMGLGISIMSYDGKVRVGVATDVHQISDPEFIMKAFMEEYSILCEGLAAEPEKLSEKKRVKAERE